MCSKSYKHLRGELLSFKIISDDLFDSFYLLGNNIWLYTTATPQRFQVLKRLKCSSDACSLKNNITDRRILACGLPHGPSLLRISNLKSLTPVLESSHLNCFSWRKMTGSVNALKKVRYCKLEKQTIMPATWTGTGHLVLTEGLRTELKALLLVGFGKNLVKRCGAMQFARRWPVSNVAPRTNRKCCASANWLKCSHSSIQSPSMFFFVWFFFWRELLLSKCCVHAKYISWTCKTFNLAHHG